MNGDKIKKFRMIRGYTQEYMADKLNIAQNTYSKYENNSERLPIETIERIASILGVSINDITSTDPIIINNQTPNQGAQGRIEHFYVDQKELYEKLLDSKNKEIERLTHYTEHLFQLLNNLKKEQGN
jgi:transcriptional regulator with XRE-family HTH domain